jgi:hypothetical protein
MRLIKLSLRPNMQRASKMKSHSNLSKAFILPTNQVEGMDDLRHDDDVG